MISNNGNPFAFWSLVTGSPEAYKKAIEFYKLLGFKLVKNYVRDTNAAASTLELEGISYESVRESWLESFPSASSSGQGVAVKLRLSNYSTETIDDSNDMTRHGTRLVFYCEDLDTIRSRLEDNGYEVTNNPEEDTENGINDYSFKTRDPIGTYILFSKYASPLQTIADKSSVSSESLTSPSSEGSVASLITSGKKKIAIMTSGGDSAGMNAVVRAVVRAGIHYDCDVFGIYDGYNGLVSGGNMIKKMDWYDVRGWLSLGGTLIGTARNKEFRERSGRLKAAYNLVSNGIDSLVVCGGDGSLTGADLFRSDWPSLMEELVSTGKLTEMQVAPYKRLSIVGLVGSIDNDMAMTDRTIGAFSALERIIEMVDYIDATATSHSRAFVIEVMGRHCGWLALMAGISTGADYIFIPERPDDATNWKDKLSKVCMRHREKGHRKTTVIVAEGAIDNENKPITSEDVKKVLVDLGLDTRVTQLGHVQRGGTACAYDRMLGTLQGVEAVKAVLEDDGKSPSPMIGILEGKIVRKPLLEAVKLTKSVAAAIAAKDFDKAMSLRDSEFAECYNNYIETTMYDDGSHKLPEDQRLNIAVVHVGAPTSALNAATRSMALYSFAKGHRLFAIQNGFAGLIRHGAVRELHYNDVNSWYNLGGSVIGTNRSLPSQDMGTIAYYFQKYNFDGLVLVGGYEAFTSLQELQEARKQYPIFNIPMVAIPATVSNNVPGTEYSLGSDTCMNELVKYCDAIKQSASASRKRVFVIEVQGGYCGYIASYISLITGAIASYTPEEKISLKKIREDISLLEESFKNDGGENRSGKIFIRNEKASKIFTTELITDIIAEQSHGKFGSRTAIPGHVQQGNYPSSLDRVNANRLGVKACEFIEKWNSKIDWKLNDSFHDESDPKLRFRYVNGVKFETVKDSSELSACVVSIQGSHIGFRSVVELMRSGEVDEKFRKSKKIFWSNYTEANDMLSGKLYVKKSA
ncbi:6-phosphofructokinase subunit alpha [Saccharomycopsis crataegensis]|uniref:ATP-dependent 6-phosphofructokinase n=1 Tax=Saccharomycopsis crataegensis TaxID=43959 RepID=A0AAV5QVX4_9ASCO|nr:6-phosphofructokinase subunit alpha [Saccharomycopsis crataegensis]